MERTNTSRKKSVFITLQHHILVFFILVTCTIQGQKKYYESGKIKLKLTEEMATMFETAPLQKTASGIIEVGSAELNEMHTQFRATQYTRVFPYAGKFEKKHRKYGLHLWYEIEVDPNTDVLQAVEGYKALLGVQFAEPVYIPENFEPVVAQLDESTINSLKASSNDPYFPQQYGYENTGQTNGTPGADISLLEAWDIQTGSSDVIVAIVDSGVDVEHQDLKANMWTNADEIPNNGIDDDNNGYIDDIHGYNFGERQGTILPGSHGTHVAGTVAAVSNNNIGVAGVAGGDGSGNGVRLMSCQVFSNITRGFDVSYVYAADNGAVIAQSSWGYALGYYDQAVRDGIHYFLAEAGYDENGNPVGPMQGGIAFFSAGNQGTTALQYPAADPLVIAVASTDHNDNLSSFSNRGDWVEIAAPGSLILSTFPNNDYGIFSGTSMACPHASGVAALMLSEFPGITPDDMRTKITTSADPLNGSLINGGRLNAYAALQGGDINTPPVADLTATPTSGVAPLVVSFDASGSTDADGDTLSYSIDYGDGTSGTGVTSTHTYAAGNYTAIVTVADGNGGSDTASVAISVSGDTGNTPPVADLTATPTSGVAPLVVSFDASGSTDADGDTLSYSIDYGDGTSGTGATSTHTYTAGNYTAVVTVTDGNGGSDTASVAISVSSDGDNDCQFNTPLDTPLSTTGYSPYKNIYVLGTGGPDLSNVTDFTINWDLSNNGLYQFSMLTNNGVPSWWNDLLPRVSHTFGSAQPAVTISGSGFAGLDGSYYAATDDDNFVLVSIDSSFTIYFSNDSQAPTCGESNALLASKSGISLQPMLLPNPVKSNMTLFNLQDVVRITITDILGHTVFTNATNANSTVIDVSGYQSGMYVISYHRQKGVTRSTFMKE